MFSYTNANSTIYYKHVAKRAPSEDECLYMNCKNGHIINVQVMCDTNTILIKLMPQ